MRTATVVSKRLDLIACAYHFIHQLIHSDHSIIQSSVLSLCLGCGVAKSISLRCDADVES